MQIKVHGTTVIASFKQEVERSDQHMRDLISHLNGDGAIAVADSPSADEARANATEMAISVTGETKNGVGEDGNQLDPPDQSQELYTLLSAVLSDDIDETKSDTSLDRGPVDKNITDSKFDTRPAANDSNVPNQNVTDAASLSTAPTSEILQDFKNISGTLIGMNTSLGSRAEEAVSKETPSRDGSNATLLMDITVPLPTSNDSVVSSSSAGTISVATSAVISSNVERNGADNVPGTPAGASASADTGAVGNSSAKTAELSTPISISEDLSVESSSVEVVKENATTSIPKIGSISTSVLPLVSLGAAVDNSSAASDAKKPLSNVTSTAVDSGEARAEPGDSTKSTITETKTETMADSAIRTITGTGAGELDEANTTAAAVNATAGRNEHELTGDNVHIVLIGNATEKSGVEVNAMVPVLAAPTDPPISGSDASAAALRGSGNTTKSNLTECSKDSTLPLPRQTATNITGTSDLNSTVSAAEITTPAVSALASVNDTDAEADSDGRTQGDMTPKEPTHSDASGGASEGSRPADLLDGLSTAASNKYETILTGDDKEREWDKDDKISPLETANLSGYGTLALGGVGSAAGALSPLAAGPLSAALLDSPVLPLLIPPGQLRSINGPTAGFSPLCLETLRFTEFQAMMANKLKQRADSDKTQLPLHSQDNVFRQLMMKIKTLEMNYAIIEMYSAQVSRYLHLLLRHASI